FVPQPLLAVTLAMAPAEDAAEHENLQESRKARMEALCARLSQKSKEDHAAKVAEDERTTERWSGLRILDRCVRQEKWDASMRGKDDLVPLRHLGGLLRKEKDKVVIAVLASVAAGQQQGKLCCEWKLTDLDLDIPAEATLMLLDRAREHWSLQEVKAGDIFAVLNPQLACRSGSMIATFETQLIKLGSCPSFGRCQALDEGRPCPRPCHREGSGVCAQHGKRGYGQARKRRKTLR
ncbi:unnamed protein product, partial [Effrenium voratum]